jgi:integrase/recombinase XerC
MPGQLQLLIQPFLSNLRFEKRYSSHTIRSYQDDLVQFFDFIELGFGETALADISSAITRSWIVSLKDAGLSAKSINRKLSSLKSFFKYQLKTGVLEVTPVANIVAPKSGRRLPSYVEQKDMAGLLDTIEFPADWNGKTDRLLISIFYHTGIRLSELVNLKESHIDSAKRTLKVLGKGNKERIIPVSESLVSEMMWYRDLKRAEMENFDPAYLLVNKNGKKLYHKYVYRVVKACLEKVTTIEKKSPHVLRHSFATHLTNNGAPLQAVKELLGHASLAATQIYTHNTIEKLKDIHKKAHPKS